METKTWNPLGVIVLVCVVAVMVAGIIVLRVKTLGPSESAAKKQVEAEIARIRAAGEPVSAADLRGPKIPDSENGAVVYARAFKMAEGFDKSLQGDEYSALTSTDPSRRTPEVMAKARTLVAKYKAVVPVIDQAVGKPKCRFPVKWEDGYNAMFPHCAKLRRLSRLLSAVAVVDAYDGRVDDALHAVELNMKMSDSLKEEPTVISQLVRIAVLAIAGRSLDIVAGRVKIDEAWARRLYRVASGQDFSRCTDTAYQGERAMLIEIVQDYQASGKLPNVTSDETKLPDSWASRFFYSDVLYQLERWKVVIAESPKPYRTLISGHSSVLEEKDPPYMYILSATLMPAFGKFPAKRDAAIARLALCKAELALRLYEGRHGQYPTTLAEAAKDAGLAIPQDPFSGKSLVYKKQGKGCIVYSVDQDLKDNGGAVPKKYRGPVPRIPPELLNSKPGEMPNIPPPPPGWEQMEAERNKRDIVVRLDR